MGGAGCPLTVPPLICEILVTVIAWPNTVTGLFTVKGTVWLCPVAVLVMVTLTSLAVRVLTLYSKPFHAVSVPENKPTVVSTLEGGAEGAGVLFCVFCDEELSLFGKRGIVPPV